MEKIVKMLLKDKTLYAHWDARNYTVIFDGNGGTPSYSNKTVIYDSKYGTLPTASRTGYTFLGWYTTASGGTQVTNNTTVKITSTQTLYAHWKANAYVVTLLKNDGTSNSAGTVSVTYNSKYGNLASTSRVGYTFSGWYTSATGGIQVTSDTLMTTASNHTLYAHWKLDKIFYSTLSIHCANYTKGSSPYTIQYSGNCSAHDDGNDKWRIKFLTSGELKLSIQTKIDAFLVGGGGVGGGKWGGGGGGGYTKTFNGLTLNSNKSYKISIGSGGSGGSNTDYPNSWTGSDGESTTIVIDNKTYEAKGGSAGGLGNTSAGCASGGAGGSGGGGGGLWSGEGGTNGTKGDPGGYINGASQEKYCEGGNGQDTTTGEFGNPKSTLYSSGGKGCGQGEGYYGYKSASGEPNTGAGGEGGSTTSTGGSGGSGIVVIRDAR